MRALLIDDDHALSRLLREYLEPHGVTLDHADRGTVGLERLRAAAYDVVLLDVMLPGMDGFEVCKAIRAEHDVPVIMLTARGEDTDRIVGLELGADDYVPKPYNPRELHARMKAVVRRARPAPAGSAAPGAPAAASSETLRVGALRIDVQGRRVLLGDREVELTSYEFRLLLVLARHAGQTVAREELAAALRGDEPGPPKPGRYDPSVDRSLDVHISHLRQKLEEDAPTPRRIKTVRGIGYVLVRPAADEE